MYLYTTVELHGTLTETENPWGPLSRQRDSDHYHQDEDHGSCSTAAGRTLSKVPVTTTRSALVWGLDKGKSVRGAWDGQALVPKEGNFMQVVSSHDGSWARRQEMERRKERNVVHVCLVPTYSLTLTDNGILLIIPQYVSQCTSANTFLITAIHQHPDPLGIVTLTRPVLVSLSALQFSERVVPIPEDVLAIVIGL